MLLGIIQQIKKQLIKLDFGELVHSQEHILILSFTDTLFICTLE